MARLDKDKLFGTVYIAQWTAPVITEAGVVTTPPYLKVQRDGGSWVTAVTLPATTADEARKPCGYDITIEPDRSVVLTYSLAGSATIYQKTSTDAGATWA